MRPDLLRALVLLGFAALLLAGIPAQPAARAATAATMAFSDGAGVAVDGTVGPSEYPAASYYHDAATGMDTYLIHDGTTVTGAVVGAAAGWVAVGIGPAGTVMDGSNIIIGYVASGTAYLSDQFGVGFDHKSDVSLGGTDNLLAQAGTESGGTTTIEFRIPLDSGDAYDVRLQAGTTYSMILAYQATADDFVTMHTAAGIATVFVQPDPNRIPTRHASLSFGVAGTPVQGEDATLEAELLGDNGTARFPADIEFYVNTTVGWGFLGTAGVDPSGRVAYNYTFLSPGAFEFRARYAGDQDYLPTEANLTVTAAAADAPAAGISALQVGHLIMVTVLGGVVLVYMYSMAQVFRISKAGRVRPPGSRRPGEKASATEGTPPAEAGKRSEPGQGEDR